MPGTSAKTRLKLKPWQSQLVAENLALARFLARKWSAQCPGLAEQYGDAAIDGLIAAARVFDPGRNLKFTTLASRCIRNAMIEKQRFLARERRSPELPLLPILQPGECGDGHATEPAVPGRLPDDDIDFEGLIAPLDARERDVIRRRFHDDLSTSQIGVRLGLSKGRVHQIQAGALFKLAALECAG